MATNQRSNGVLFTALAEFLQPTPSAVAKLLATWDSLRTETQIYILDQLSAMELPPHLAKRVCLKALESPNAYLRYLASARLYARAEQAGDQETTKALIKADPDPLVRYALLERRTRGGVHNDSLEDPEKFFLLPQEARLAMVRSRTGNGTQIAAIIEHALITRVVSDVELLEILSDYVNNPLFQHHLQQTDRRGLHDSNTEWEIGQEIEALWRLVPLLPPAASRLLIEVLPERAGLCLGIPQEVLENLSDEQAIRLFERQDIELKSLRKNIALRRQDRSTSVRISAMKHNFDLTYKEFSAFIFDPELIRTRAVNLTPLDLADKRKLDILQELANGAEHLSPVFYEAIRDLLLETPLTISGAAHAAALARHRLHLWLKDHHGEHYEQQRRELRLYRLAKKAVPWSPHKRRYKPSGELAFLGDKVSAGNTWDTFMAFSEAWEDVKSLRLDKHLPRLHEIGETCIATDDEKSDTAKLINATRQVEAKLDAILEVLRKFHAECQRGVEPAALEGNLRALQNEVAAGREALEPIHIRLARMEKLDRLRIALFVMLALFIVGLLLLNVE